MLEDFLSEHMRQRGRRVPARLQAALALLEKLRDDPQLELSIHLASGGSAGLESHETYGKRAHERHSIDPISSTHGRRSSHIASWAPELFELLQANGFDAKKNRKRIIDVAQLELVQEIKAILDAEPLVAKLRERSAEAVIRDLLRQAELRGRTGEVAQYLVGAKLMLRLDRRIEAAAANRRDRTSRFDDDARAGDFELADTVIEVAVGLPDDKHLEQVVRAYEETRKEVWVLTRSERTAIWRTEIDAMEGLDPRRVVVAGIEAFVGQNITEMGQFDSDLKIEHLRKLIALYNSHWIAPLNVKGISIVVK